MARQSSGNTSERASKGAAGEAPAADNRDQASQPKAAEGSTPKKPAAKKAAPTKGAAAKSAAAKPRAAAKKPAAKTAEAAPAASTKAAASTSAAKAPEAASAANAEGAASKASAKKPAPAKASGKSAAKSPRAKAPAAAAAKVATAKAAPKGTAAPENTPAEATAKDVPASTAAKKPASSAKAPARKAVTAKKPTTVAQTTTAEATTAETERKATTPKKAAAKKPSPAKAKASSTARVVKEEASKTVATQESSEPKASAKPAHKPRAASAKAQAPAAAIKAAPEQEATAEAPQTLSGTPEPVVAKPASAATVPPKPTASAPSPTEAVAESAPEAPRPAAAVSNVPVIPAQPGSYGQVKPIQKKRSRKGAIAAVAVIAAVVIAAIVAAPRIIDAMSPAQMLPSTSGPVTVLTTSRVSDDLENMDIPMPDLGTYSYILTDDLIGPRFSLPDIEDMMQTVSGDQPSYSQKITTKATYNNKGIRIIVPISVVYTYDEAGQTWTHGEPTLGTAETEPLSAASYEAVLEDIDLIIRNYEDESFKTLFKGAEITGQTPSLTKDGGTIAVNLFSQTETQTASAVATVALTWDGAKGWVASIAETTAPEVTERDLKQEILDKEQEEADQAEEEAYANEAKPQYHIECTNADVVEFNGKMTRSGNGYLLTLNDPLRLTLDGELCYVHTIALTFGEYEDYAVYKPEDIDPEALVGSNQGFAGTLSYTDAGSKAVSFANSKNRDHAYETGAPLVTMRVIEA